MTTQPVPIDTVAAEQMLPWLQHHILAWTGYAFALAQRAGLTPEVAAQIFMSPIIDAGQVTFQADAASLEQQAMQNAVIMSAFHGANNVHLERDGDTWLLKIATAAIKQELELWGVFLDFFALWLGEQARLIGEPKGIVYTSWLEDETLYLQLTLARQI